MDIKIVSSLDKVFAHFGPTLFIEEYSMLKNERYHLQLCIYNDEWRKTEVKVEVKGSLSKYCQLRIVDNVPAETTNYSSSDDYYIFDRGESRLYPDILRPFEYGDVMIPSKQWKSVWCTIHCPSGLPTGKHTLIFAVDVPEKDTMTAELNVEVMDVSLPESDLFYTNWFHYDGIANYYNIKPWTKKYYSVLGSFIDSAVLHGMNILYTPVFTPALDTKVGWERMDVQLVKITEKVEGVYSFDFTELNAFIDFAQSKGIKYFELSHLTTQWGAKACPKIMAFTKNGYERIFGWDTPSFEKKYKTFLAQFLPAIDKFLKEKGIFNKVFFHISDEPNTEDFEAYKQIAQYIKGYLKDYKILDASSTESNDFVDIPVLATTHIPDSVGKNVWAYYCSDYLSNRFFNMPSQRNRILGMQLYERDINGFLHWGFNFYNTVLSYRPINPLCVSDAGGAFPAGDSFVVYPGHNGAWDSLRLEVFYDALQDRMILKLLESFIGREKVLELLHNEGVRGWKEYPRDAKWHIMFREKLSKMVG